MTRAESTVQMNPAEVARKRIRRRRWKSAGKYAIWMVAALIALIPLYWMIVVAITPFGMSRVPNPELFPSEPTLENFVRVLTDRPVGLWILNSTVVGLGAASAAVTVGTFAGYAVARFQFRGAKVLALAILSTEMIPQVSLIVPFFKMFSDLGLLNSSTSLVLAHMTTVVPLTMWLLAGYFSTVPRELEQAAMVDGAGQLGAMMRIAIPLAAPGIAATFVYAFIVSWNDLIFARTLISQPSKWTAPVGLSSFSGEYFTLFEPLMAASLLFAAPAVLVFIVMQRWFVSGLTAGGVKN